MSGRFPVLMADFPLKWAGFTGRAASLPDSHTKLFRQSFCCQFFFVRSIHDRGVGPIME
jgi:hypothetical protein